MAAYEPDAFLVPGPARDTPPSKRYFRHDRAVPGRVNRLWESGRGGRLPWELLAVGLRGAR